MINWELVLKYSKDMIFLNSKKSFLRSPFEVIEIIQFLKDKSLDQMQKEEDSLTKVSLIYANRKHLLWFSKDIRNNINSKSFLQKKW